MLSGKTLTTNMERVDTKKELGSIAGLSHNTINRVKVIEAKASYETNEQLSTQEISINQACKEIKKVPKVPKVQLYK